MELKEFYRKLFQQSRNGHIVQKAVDKHVDLMPQEGVREH